MTAIDVHGLSKRFGDKTVVDNLTARASLVAGLAMRPLKSRLTFDINAMYLLERPPTALATDFLKALARTIDALSRPA